MKENIFDDVLDGVQGIIEEVSDSIAKDFKNVKPFDKEPVSTGEMLYSYNTLRPEDMGYLVNKYGRERMSQFIYEMETLKKKQEARNAR